MNINLSSNFINNDFSSGKNIENKQEFNGFLSETNNVYENTDIFVNSNSTNEVAEDLWAMKDSFENISQDENIFSSEEFAQASQSYEYQDTFNKMNDIDGIFRWFD